MIDYNKLQEAHNLAYKLAKQDKQAVSIGVQFFVYDKTPGDFLINI